MNIELKDLIGSEIGIRQLMNSHNDQAKRRIEAERRLSDKESEVEFLKTSPFVSVVMLIVAACGTVVLSIGINLITADKPPSYALPLVGIGAALILLSGLTNVLYPFARGYFNKRKLT